MMRLISSKTKCFGVFLARLRRQQNSRPESSIYSIIQFGQLASLESCTRNRCTVPGRSSDGYYLHVGIETP